MKKRILSLLLVLMMIVSLVPTAAMAYSSTDVAYAVTGGNIYFNESTGTITDCDTSVTEAIIPSEINGVAVTSIGDSAFRFCDDLRTFAFSASVKNIGKYAFSNCDSLTTILIPDSILSIGDSAFAFCDNLESATVPGGLVSIGDRIFWSCEKLSDVTLSDALTVIGNYMFEDCTSLTSVTFPSKLTQIGGGAFEGCTGLLSSLVIPENVTYVGYGAFANCTSLKEVTICNPEAEVNAFSGCDSIEKITHGGVVYTLNDGVLNVTGNGRCTGVFCQLGEYTDQSCLKQVIFRLCVNSWGRAKIKKTEVMRE